MTRHGVVLFYTTSAALRAEKLLIGAGYAVKLIPTPRQFSSDCGVALRFDWNEEERVRGVLGGARVEYDATRVLNAGPI